MASLMTRLKHSSSLKLITIIAITVTLLIPVSMVENTIHERSSMRHQAESTIGQRWGAEQQISAPVLVIPYKEKIVEKVYVNKGWIHPDNVNQKSTLEKKISYIDHTAYLLADKTDINTQMTTEIRYLGIYDMPVYITKTKITGSFNKDDFATLEKNYTNINWQQARLILPVKDVRGIRAISSLTFGEQQHDFVPSNNHSLSFNGIEADIKLNNNETVSFSLEISLAGSKQLNYLPLSRTSNISLLSDWSSPGFSGSYLPVTRNISDTGFDAEWKILDLNRSFAQLWHDDSVTIPQINEAEFGLTLYQPADVYQQNIRSVKYAVLFIALTFMAFFLFEIFFKLHIHPVQYFFNGGALSTFYLLLLAMSEHMNFSIAYLLSSAAIVTLMSGYSMTILKQKSRGLLIGLITALIYAFLYFLIQSEQSSLLFGATGFFIALSVIMYLTRHIDWYNISSIDNLEKKPDNVKNNDTEL